MGFKATKNGGGDFQRELVPAGNHRAAIVAVVYMGLHEEPTFKDKSKMEQNEKVCIVYELLDEERPEGGDVTGPYVIQRVYTASTFEKAAFTKVCQSVLMRPLKTEEVEDGLDLEVLTGKAVMIEVKHKPIGNVVYDNVGDVTPVASVLRKLPVAPKNIPFYADPDTYRDHDWIPWVFGKKLIDKIAERVKDDRPSQPAKQQPANVGAGGSSAGEAF